MRSILSAFAVVLMSSSAFAADISVKLAVLNDASGGYADMTGEGSVAAARLAVEDFTAAHPNFKIDLVSADHQNKPDIASNIARRWISEDGVDAILDVPTMSAAFAVNDIVRETNKVFLNSGGASADLTGKACSPNTVHWTYDTWQVSHGTGNAVVAQGGDSWFFITVDYSFGHALEKDATDVVQAAGGRVLGSVRHPFPGSDFSSFLLSAQSSGAKVVGLANGGKDAINTIKQAAEFGITQSGQQIAALLMFINDVHALGLETAQGLFLTESFYWDLNDVTRTWSARFEEKMGRKPSMIQAGVYASAMHYLKAVEALGSPDDGRAVVAKMKEMPTDDLFGRGEIRADGRKIHDSYLFRVKKPAESKGPWDYYEKVATIPAADAFRPLKDGGCPLVK